MPAAGGEAAWLSLFLAARKLVLQRDWPDAVDRVTTYQQLLAGGDLNLDKTFNLTVYGDKFAIVYSATLGGLTVVPA